MTVIPYKNRSDSKMEKAEAVQSMFDNIARRYDLMNDVMTGGMHRRWKSMTAQKVCRSGASKVLDIASGTGDIGFALEKAGAGLVVCIDFSTNMLSRAKKRAEKKGSSSRLGFSRSDALELPFPDESFDGAATGFSLRNVDGIDKMFEEINRVLKRGGKFASLELTHLKSSFVSKSFNLYFKKIVPIIGGIFTGYYEAYDYLPESIANVPDAEKVKKMMESAGFTSIEIKRLGLGSVAMVSGAKE